MSIARLIQLTGTSRQMIHYYELKGLLPRAACSGAGPRRFTIDAVRRVQFIHVAKDLGFSLADVRELLSLRTGEQVERAGMRARIERHLNRIDRKMVALRAMAATLQRLLDLLDRDRRSDDCPILESLEQTTTRG